MNIDSLGVTPPSVMRELVAAGSVSDVSIQAAEQGLVIIVRLGSTERVLGVARGGIRHFKSLDGAASFLQDLGIFQFEVDTNNWIPKTKMVIEAST